MDGCGLVFEPARMVPNFYRPRANFVARNLVKKPAGIRWLPTVGNLRAPPISCPSYGLAFVADILNPSAAYIFEGSKLQGGTISLHASDS